MLIVIVTSGSFEVIVVVVVHIIDCRNVARLVELRAPDNHVMVISVGHGQPDESQRLPTAQRILDGAVEILFREHLVQRCHRNSRKNLLEIALELGFDIRVVRIKSAHRTVEKPVHRRIVPVTQVCEVLAEQVEYPALFRADEFHRRTGGKVRIKVCPVLPVVRLDIGPVVVHPPVEQVRGRGRPA